jgi:TolB-like protein
MERRLAAILAADVAGYSRLMGIDEERTHKGLKAHYRELVEPKIQQHRGRIIKNTGDGLLAEFTSVIDAVRCATEIQQGMAVRNAEIPDDRRIDFRIGVHQGDIITDCGDIFGDGVNVAARLEGIADPGGVCISARVQEDLRGTLDLPFDDIGEQQLKNIQRPVRAYRVNLQNKLATSRPSLTLPDKPSIAVLPFLNLSGDPDQEYFADGMVDEIITSLSRIGWLIVASRTSTFVFKGQSADVRDIARKLNVRYVLEGSVRRAGDRVRIIGQLIDATSGTHLWADRIDGRMNDLFELQDRVTESVIGAIEPKLRFAEIERAKRKRAENMDAYDYYLRALPASYRPTPSTVDEALRLLEKGRALDPNYPSANALTAWFYFYRVVSNWSGSPQEDRANIVRLARAAVEHGTDDPSVLGLGGFLLATGGHVDEGAAAGNRAIALSPNSPLVVQNVAWTLTLAGDQDRALGYFNSAIRLEAANPRIFRALTGATLACVLAGRFAEAVEFGERARRDFAGWGPTHRFLAAAYAQTGDTRNAAEALAHLNKLEPAVTISHLRSSLPFQNQEQAERLWEGLRKAGMPE